MSNASDARFIWPIVGHGRIISYLQHGLINQRVSHAYLFVGPAHVGKKITAEYFSRALVCEEFSGGKGIIPCGKCQACRQAENNIHPDVFWLKREINEKTDKLKKNISIEQVRELQGRLSHRSFFNSYKVAVIEEAHTLSAEASNSLLKTLEEPSPKTVLILLAEGRVNLPLTIISRCQVIKFLPVASKEIFEHLASLRIDQKKARAITAAAFGRPGIAINYALASEQYLDFQAEIKDFISLMGSEIHSRFLLAAEAVDLKNVDSVQEVLLLWRRVVRDLILIKLSLGQLISNVRMEKELESLAGSYSLSRLISIILAFDESRKYLAANVNAKLTIENLVLNF
ncbi:DNA polymerase III subunit delta' [Candidatus Falkowbacteria bacterium]|nr:DNA polymerase III subunit delta' [Candidatus Falkowbacteria bacterium]